MARWNVSKRFMNVLEFESGVRAHIVGVDVARGDVHAIVIHPSNVDPAALKQQSAQIVSTQELQWRNGPFGNGLETFSSSKPACELTLSAVLE